MESVTDEESQGELIETNLDEFKGDILETPLIESADENEPKEDAILEVPRVSLKNGTDDESLFQLRREKSLQQLMHNSKESFMVEEDSRFSILSKNFPADHLSQLYITAGSVAGSSEIFVDDSESIKQPTFERVSMKYQASEDSVQEQPEVRLKEPAVCIGFVEPFKCYVKTASLEQLDLNAKLGIVKKRLPTLTINDVVLHNKEDDCWVIINGVVRDLTSLIQKYKQNGQYKLVKPIVANAGKDISVWFHNITGDILHFVHPITGVYVPYTPLGRIADVGIQVPSVEWKQLTKVPWWQDTRNIVGTMTKQSRPIRILNLLAGVEIKMLVCCEDTINDIQDKYLHMYNRHAKSYTWKFDTKVLDMNLTLEENGVKDESKLFLSIGLPESTYIPCLMIYFNDDLTEV